MTLNLHKNIYDDYFDSMYKRSNDLTAPGYEITAAAYERNLAKFIPKDRNSKILDIGCGTGHFLSYLKTKDYKNYLGIDISHAQIRFCKAHVTQNVMQGDALSWFDHENGGYDLIVAFDFLEHISKSQVIKFLAKLYGCLNNNGMFFLRVPNMSNPFSINSFYRDFTHATGYTETSLYQILSTTGFKKIQIFSSAPSQNTIRKKIRIQLLNLLHLSFRFLYYIQDFQVPEHFGKNLIVISAK